LKSQEKITNNNNHTDMMNTGMTIRYPLVPRKGGLITGLVLLLGWNTYITQVISLQIGGFNS